MELQNDLAELLCTVVEASRNASRKQPFYAMGPTAGTTLGSLMHDGLPDRHMSVYIGDVQELVDLGLLAVRYYGEHQFNFDVSTLGFAAYEDVRGQLAKPADAVEQTMVSYVASDSFSSRYPGAYEKWLTAERALWPAEGNPSSTRIGHSCREALQDFAEALVQHFQLSAVDPDRTHVVARVRSVIDSLRPRLGETVSAFLDALLNYWGCTQDLVQRQEHGAGREREDLIWEDSRRVVFQTLAVMYELDRTLSLLRA